MQLGRRMGKKREKRVSRQTKIIVICWFIFSRIKKGEGQGKEKCHAKSMMSKETNERLKRDTQHVPLRQNAEEKIREKGLKVV